MVFHSIGVQLITLGIYFYTIFKKHLIILCKIIPFIADKGRHTIFNGSLIKIVSDFGKSIIIQEIRRKGNFRIF